MCVTYSAVAGFTPFVVASYEFGKRILIQRRCEMCKGSGLVQRGKYLRKCTACGAQEDAALFRISCSPGQLLFGSADIDQPFLLICAGGFLPWQSWQRFFESSPGNGAGTVITQFQCR